MWKERCSATSRIRPQRRSNSTEQTWDAPCHSNLTSKVGRALAGSELGNASSWDRSQQENKKPYIFMLFWGQAGVKREIYARRNSNRSSMGRMHCIYVLWAPLAVWFIFMLIIASTGTVFLITSQCSRYGKAMMIFGITVLKSNRHLLNISTHTPPSLLYYICFSSYTGDISNPKL